MNRRRTGSTVVKALFVTAAVTFALSCDKVIPLKEMVRAKQAIGDAYEVKADRYDPENLGVAEKKLYSSHDQTAKSDVKKATTDANDAYKAARAAIKNSLPLLAADSLEQARAVRQKALNLYAEKFAPEDLDRGSALIDQADALNAAGSYRESYAHSLSAIDALNRAISGAEEGVSALEVALGRLTAERDSLIARDTAKSAHAELEAAGAALALAGEHLGADRIREADGTITEAEQYLRAARIRVLALPAREKIKTLRANIENLKKERGDDYAAGEIEQSLACLNEAESLLDQERGDDALAKIAEAESHFLAALLKTEQGVSEEKIAAAEALLKKIIAADAARTLAAETDRAAGLIEEAKTLHASGNYRQAGARAGEAEALLRSLSFAAGDAGDVAPDGTDLDAVTYYVVRLNVKDRDCLWKIALRMYNNARLWPLIYVANREQIKDPDLIFPGQKFKIPPVPVKKTGDDAGAADQGGDSVIRPEEAAPAGAEASVSP
jgi:hypothetical protein